MTDYRQDNLDDTRPRPAVTPARYQPRVEIPNAVQDEIPAPPRFLFWAIIGAFVLGIVSVIAAVLIFRSVLLPAQQQRVMDSLPFMEAFLPPRPAPDAILPTLEIGGGNPDDLLNSPLFTDEEATATPEITPTLEETEVSVIVPTATALPTETLVPTLTPTPEPTIAPTQTPLPQSAAVTDLNAANTNTSQVLRSSSARLTGFRYEKQTWNNCGPANITMGLSYYGWQQTQDYAESYLKPADREDKNVNPWEMVNFVNERSQVRALYRVGGSLDMIKTFLSNNIPVIIETGYMPEGYDWMGHYQTIVGYDDTQGVFYIYDSFLGQGASGEGVIENYAFVDRFWQHFNRTFIVIYEPSREDLVMSILGEHADPTRAAEIAYETARQEATADPQNGFAWFNMGSSLVALGDYERATTAFAQASRVGSGLPWRMLWYQFGPYEAYYNVGSYNDVLTLVNATLANGGEFVEETYYWQGRALAALGRTNEAATAYRLAIRRNPNYVEARQALEALGL